jgi:hypothetical protein
MTTLLHALKLLSVACALLVGLAALPLPATERAGTAARQQTRDDGAAATTEDPLDTFDRVVRARFHNHIGFGMARIATERRFAPETEEERRAVAAVRRAKIKVGLYLVGRGILSEVPPEQRRAVNLFSGMWPGGTVRGPIFLNATEIGKLPAASVYWEEARRAMQSFAAGAESYDFEADGWRALARPVRAAESCLQCHVADMESKPVEANGRTFHVTGPGSNRLKVGDPLGAVLYVYRRRG